MHYRQFTSSDSILIVAVLLAVYLLIQWYRKRRSAEGFKTKPLLIALALGVVTTVLSTLVYGETQGSRELESISYELRGYPRYVYRALATAPAGFGDNTTYYPRHMLENTAIYTAGALVLLSAIGLFRSPRRGG